MAKAVEQPKIDDLKRLLRRLEQVSSDTDIVLGSSVSPAAGSGKDAASAAKAHERPAARRLGAADGDGIGHDGKSASRQPATGGGGSGASVAVNPSDPPAPAVIPLAAVSTAARPPAAAQSADAGQDGTGASSTPGSTALAPAPLAALTPPPEPARSGRWTVFAAGLSLVLAGAGVAAWHLEAGRLPKGKSTDRGAGEAAPDFAAAMRQQQRQPGPAMQAAGASAASSDTAGSIAAVDAPRSPASEPRAAVDVSPPPPPDRQPADAVGEARPKGAIGESEVLRTQPQRGRDKFDSEVRLEAYLERGQRLIEEGDLTAARSFFRRAAESGDPRGALALGMTYDTNYFAELGIRGQQGDDAAAGQWYRKAMDLGSKDALDRLERLKQQ